MEEASRTRCTLPRCRRLIQTAAFGAVLSARGDASCRSSSKWLSVSALVRPAEDSAGLRFGFTVGKANAHRGVDRQLVKRVLRESARLSQRELVSPAARLDVVIRLKRKLPALGIDVHLEDFKKELRADCDQLLERFFAKLGEKALKP